MGFIWMCFRPQRKRLLSDHHHSQPIDDLDNTRDSVLSGQSHTSSDNSEPDMIIIDFEYCAYNYRGFDLANHFIEWTLDYTNKEFPFYYHRQNQYPTVEQQVQIDKQSMKKLNTKYSKMIYFSCPCRSDSLPHTCMVWIQRKTIPHRNQISKNWKRKYCVSPWPRICSGASGHLSMSIRILNSATG